ncbi:hypothetical protein B7494_g5933 [Chlorociboria aeruginascens]|nr:hypothetical protein B7494_g5933 [Chlorociboria aeruginascens]
MSASRQYEIVVFGASGYTGKLTAEYIAKSLPTDLRWAIAGRSTSKLEAVAAECKALNPDRIQPAIEISTLDGTDLAALAKKTTLLISTVGPYAIYGQHAFKACAENGTHYLDVTGEVAWVSEMITKYEKAATANGSIMIPQIGIESAPPDLITWSLVDTIREKFSSKTGEVVVSVDLSGTLSGGTLATALSYMDIFSLKQVAAAHSPYALSPIPGPKSSITPSLVTRIFGVRSIPDLGILTTALMGMTDAPIVQRSWGMLGGASGYGPNFHFTEYTKVRNHFYAIVTHFGIVLAFFLLSIPLTRKIGRRFVMQPGDGPTKESARKHWTEYRGIGKQDNASEKSPRAFCRARYDGVTGLLVAEAAISILRDGHKLSGGIYTPASLGQKFIDRLHSAGFKFEKKIYE